MPETAVEPIEIYRKRLFMRSIRRGILEMDVILRAFADANLGTMERDALDLYDQFLSENDHDLFAWVSGQTECPERYAVLVASIQHESNHLA